MYGSLRVAKVEDGVLGRKGVVVVVVGREARPHSSNLQSGDIAVMMDSWICENQEVMAFS